MKSRTFEKHPILFRAMLFVVAPIALGLIGLRLNYNASLPESEYALGAFPGNPKLGIVRDDNGVVYIDTDSLDSAFFGLGVSHAQDRLWQMEVQRRRAAGTMAEIYGYSKLSADKFSRTIGFYQLAEQDLNTLSPKSHFILQAYTKGVNHWLDTVSQLPLEFSVMGVSPKPWQIIDSLAVFKLYAFEMSGHFQNDLARLQLTRLLGSEAVALMFPDAGKPPKALAKIVPSVVKDEIDGSAMADLLALQQDFTLGRSGIGSSAWVVSPSLSQINAPMLANDLHFGSKIPATFYLAHLQGGENQLFGVTLPGVPVVLFGYNQHIAWGGARMPADTQDLFIESINPLKDNEYRVGEDWRTMTLRQESIAVKADFPSMLRNRLPALKWTVRSTKNGPLLSDILDTASLPMSLRWTGARGSDSSFDAMLSVNLASDWPSFRAATAKLVAPAITFVYGDKAGNIGMQAAGDVPIRQSGDGSYPVPARNGVYDWQGTIDKNQMPFEHNPKKGWLATANQRMTGTDYAYFISQDWAPSGRYDRITALVKQQTAQGGKLGLTDLAAMQQDQYTGLGAKLLPLMTKMVANNPSRQQALTSLEGWDFVADSDSINTTIYMLWRAQFIDLLFHSSMFQDAREVAGSKDLAHYLHTLAPDFVYRLLSAPDPVLCRKNSSDKKACSELLGKALDQTLVELSKLLGSDMDDWTWSEAHQIIYRHSIFGDVNILNTYFNRQTSHGGVSDTVNPGTGLYSSGEGFVQSIVPSFRGVYSLGKKTTSRHSLSTGQSGNVLSQYYDDSIDEHHHYWEKQP